MSGGKVAMYSSIFVGTGCPALTFLLSSEAGITLTRPTLPVALAQQVSECYGAAAEDVNGGGRYRE